MNLIAGSCTSADGTSVSVDLGALGTLTLPRGGRSELVGQAVTLGIRPEHLKLGGGAFSIEVTPSIIERLGIHTVSYATLPGGENFIALFEGDPAIEEGKSFAAGIDPAQCHLFDSAGLAVGR
jgi:multiple sugar transport system ATP-binding protein